MLNFEKLPEQRMDGRKGKFIRPGVQTLTLKDLNLESSHNTGNQRPVFFMETEPITDEGWEGYENAKGQIGKVAGNFGFYLKTDQQKEDFALMLRSIMQAVGTYDKFMAEHAKTEFTDLEAVVEATKPYIVNTKARYFVAAEQYQKLDNSGVGLKLKFPTKRVVESLDVTESVLPKFDETNSNHFKKITKTEEKVDDLPF